MIGPMHPALQLAISRARWCPQPEAPQEQAVPPQKQQETVGRQQNNELAHELRELDFVAFAVANGQDVRSPSRVASISEIQSAVCLSYKLPIETLLGPRRSREFIEPRHVAMYLCRQLTGRSLTELARRFNRDHTSVLHGVDHVSRMMVKDDRVQQTVAKLVAELGGPSTPMGKE